MTNTIRNRSLSRLRRWASAHRRGVVSVMAMMFLVLFGSLAAAMAIMSKGNIVTASTHQHVMRAQGAAETGLAIAEQRLREAASRFVVERGVVDADLGAALWNGNPMSGGTYGLVTPAPPTSYNSTSQATNVADALFETHTLDVTNNSTIAVPGIAGNGLSLTEWPSGSDPAVYRQQGWLITPAVRLAPLSANNQYHDVAFQITYAPLATGNEVRLIVTGYDFGYGAQPVTRTILQDFKLVKRVDAAVLSPSRIMIGKNVSIEGDLGALYDDVQRQYGDPLVMKSDFWGLEQGLDDQLTRLFNALATYDVDRDNRLRMGHPIEGPGAPDFSSMGYPGEAADVTNDGYLDEFDVFMMYYDRNQDGRVVLSPALTAGTPAAAETPEFVTAGNDPIDDDLGMLIDASRPDRNRNGEFRFIDNNNNGRFDPEFDELMDVAAVEPASMTGFMAAYVHYVGGQAVVYPDQVLGFRDGYVDRRDNYKKVQGRLLFRVTENQWTTYQGDYRPRLRGAVHNDKDLPPLYFGATQASMPDLTSANFTNSQTALRSLADGLDFEQQVASNLGCSVAQLATWTPAQNPAGANAPRYNPVYPDSNYDMLPDNWQTAHYEKSPYNSPTYFDWYYRPVYENMTFRNVQIPVGTNGLFKNCTFIGVTFVRSHASNVHENWSIYGKMKIDQATGRPAAEPPRYVYPGPYYPTMLSGSDRPVLMAQTPLDKADIPADQAPLTTGYNNLPDPLIINGRRVIDTKRWSNNIRFHDCVFVGGIVSDVPSIFTNARNKLEFTGATKFVKKHPLYPDDPNYNPSAAANAEIDKSTMMLPNYSVDIGSFNSPPTQDVRLRGAIVAGVLDIRGNAAIDGSLLLTFKPILGEPPMRDALGYAVGNPALFNATIGYFGIEEGDDESLSPEQLPIVNVNGTPTRIVGWDLDNDGLPDLGPGSPPTPAQQQAGATPVPFWGYGHVHFRFDPNMALPDGILLPLQVQGDRGSYREATR